MMNMTADGKMCRCTHHSVMPVFIVAFGLVFLLGALDVLSARAVSMTWPILVIVGGLMKMTGKMCSCCQTQSMPR